MSHRARDSWIDQATRSLDAFATGNCRRGERLLENTPQIGVHAEELAALVTTLRGAGRRDPALDDRSQRGVEQIALTFVDTRPKPGDRSTPIDIADPRGADGPRMHPLGHPQDTAADR